ncbi:hypothetical protein V1224_07700 [Lachnospiraceae bacterium JLR.KK008]|mgnify:FL=1|jgi:hypothetical protein|nr:hypothetical protein [uncultured Acetatifactor sp.]MCX4308550.1 hypothetical protein [Acetatifactor sp.]GFI29866.1 hypothetical protein IMSAGC013_01253 [Lachnospiraceae bacterium]
MDEVIKNICNALKEEAEAVISYTDKISSTSAVEGMDATVQALALIRLDEVEHIQNLTIELTKMMSTGALSASSMGEGEGEENEQ